MINFNKIRHEFPIDPTLTYLNHAAVSPWPQRTVSAIKAFCDLNLSRGATDYPQWIEVENDLRTLCCQLIDVDSSDDLALVKNTSEALSMIAHGIKWQAGNNVVYLAEEFPSNRIVWESLARYGVTANKITPADNSRPEQAIIDSCDDQTRLISISSVQYASGRRINLEMIGDFCRDNNILFCVDAIQSLGALTFSAKKIHADFVVADGHKWLLAPEGLALFYSRPEIRAEMTLHEYGWRMTESPMNFSAPSWRASSTASCFECGSPNMLAIHGLHASLSLLFDTGITEIEQKVLANSKHMMARLNEVSGITIITPQMENQFAGIVAFQHATLASEALHQHLSNAGIICAVRENAVRFSPHFYNNQDELDFAIDSVIKITN